MIQSRSQNVRVVRIKSSVELKLLEHARKLRLLIKGLIRRCPVQSTKMLRVLRALKQPLPS